MDAMAFGGSPATFRICLTDPALHRIGRSMLVFHTWILLISDQTLWAKIECCAWTLCQHRRRDCNHFQGTLSGIHRWPLRVAIL